MKKTNFPAYSVAMSRETGCIVMVRTSGEDVKVMGSLDREQSLNFAQGLIDWQGPNAITAAVSEALQ